MQEIEEGVDYAITSASSPGVYLCGTTLSNSITSECIYNFEKAGENADGNMTWRIRRKLNGKWMMESNLNVTYTSEESDADVWQIQHPRIYSSIPSEGDEHYEDFYKDWFISIAEGAEDSWVFLKGYESNYFLCLWAEGNRACIYSYLDINALRIIKVYIPQGAELVQATIDRLCPSGLDHYQAGEAFGQCGQAELNEAMAALEACQQLIANNSDDETACEKAANRLEAAIEALNASFTKGQSGLYFLVSLGRANENGGASPFDDNAESTLHWDYYENQLADFSNGGSMPFIWEIIQDGSSWQIKNYLTGRYIGSQSSLSKDLPLTDTPFGYNISPVTDLPGYYNIQNPENSNFALHPAAAGKGMVYWYPASNTTSANDASAWKFIKINEDELASIIKAYEQSKMNSELAALLTEATATYNGTKSYVSDATADGDFTSNPGIHIASVTSNATEPSEGSLEALFDGDFATYFQSMWSSTPEPNGYHYLQIDLGAAYQNLVMKYARRQGTGVGSPTFITIMSSDDAQSWQEEQDIELNFTIPVDVWGWGEETDNIGGLAGFGMSAPHRYIRIVVKKTQSNNLNTGYPYFYWCELRLYEANYDGENSILETIDPAVKTNLLNEMDKANEILAAGNTTQTDIERLRTAYYDFLRQFREPVDCRLTYTQLYNFKSEEGKLYSLSEEETTVVEGDYHNFTIDLDCELDPQAQFNLDYNEETGLLTITVTGSDASYYPDNVHTYTIQFNITCKVLVQNAVYDLCPNGFDGYTVGDNPGQCGQAELDEAIAAREECMRLIEEDSDDAAACEAAIERLRAAVEALTASQKMEPGFYYLVNLGRESEEGSATLYYDSNKYSPQWNYYSNDLAEKVTLETAPYVWEITQDGDLWNIKSLVGQKYIGAENRQSVGLPLEEEPFGYSINHIAGLPGYFNIQNPANADVFSMHAAMGYYLVYWNAATAEGDNPASAWAFVKVNEEGLDELRAMFEQEKANLDLADLIDNASAAYNSANSYLSDLTRDDSWESAGLVVYDESLQNITSNALEPTEGSYAGLTDGNQGTYFHSMWSEYPDHNDWHYLEIDLGKAVQEVMMKYAKRDLLDYQGILAPYSPTKITIMSTDDAPSVAERTWKEEMSIELPYQYSSTYTTQNGKDCAPIERDNSIGVAGFEMEAPHRYIRLVVKETIGNGLTSGFPFFYWSELRLYEGQGYDADYSILEMIEPEVVQTLLDEIAKAKEILAAGNATQADIDRLQAAYDEFIAYKDREPVDCELTGVAFDGEDVVLAEEGSTVIDQLYDEDALSLECADPKAKISKEYDPATGLLTVTVRGSDAAYHVNNVHTYTFQFSLTATVSTPTDITFNGEEITLAEEGTTVVDHVYTGNEDLFSIVCADDEDADILMVYDEKTGLLTVTITGSDVAVNPDNVHTYTFQFNLPKKSQLTAMNYDGTEYTVVQDGRIVVIEQLYDEEKVSLECESDPDATFELEYDEETGLLVITVIGSDVAENPDNVRTYQYQFSIPTAIDRLFSTSAQDVYTTSGVLVRKQATSLKGLPKGIYVVNGQKVILK